MAQESRSVRRTGGSASNSRASLGGGGEERACAPGVLHAAAESGVCKVVYL